MIKLLPRSLLLLSALLAGCSTFSSIFSPLDDPNQPVELTDISAQVRLQRLWTQDTGARVRTTDMVLNPVLDGGVIYTADPHGRVMAVTASDGGVTWREDLDTHITGGVGLTPELVMLGSQEGVLYALDRSTGERRWSAQLTSEILSAADGNGSIVVVTTQDGVVHALEADSGQPRWSLEIQKPLLTLRGNARPLVVANAVYLGLDNGKLVAYRPTDGGVIWEARVALPEGNTELERMVDVDVRPLIFSDLIFAVSYNGGLMAINRDSGRSEWFQEGSSRQGLAYFGGLLYASMLDSRIVAYGATTGSQVWESSALLYRGATAPAATDTYVAVGEREDGYLHLFNRRTGELIGRQRVDSSGISAAPIAEGQTVYVLDRGGDLHAYRVTPI